MNFVSYQELVADCKEFASALRQFNPRVIIGVPRSGMLAASMIGLELNLPVITPTQTIDSFFSSRFIGARHIDLEKGMWLVVDDSVRSGASIENAKQIAVEVNNKNETAILTAGLYCTEEGRWHSNFSYKIIEQPRCFEWNLFHSSQTSTTVFDIDGVFCQDPDFQEEDNNANILEHIQTAKLLRKISRPCLALCTSRLEKYKKQTVEWLRKHGIRYQQLAMCPCGTVKERRNIGTAKIKAEFYNSKNQANLFVESSEHTAREMAKFTDKPILCSDTMSLVWKDKK